MYEKIIKELGAKGVLFKSVDNIVSEPINLSVELLELVGFFKGSIVFERGAKFKTQKNIPVRDSEGFIDLDIIYGLNNDENNIFLKNKTYKYQIAEDLYVFGESGSGDQYCLSKKTGQVYYWYHEAKFENETTFLIAQTFEGFISGLCPDDDVTEKASNIISSRYDF